MRESRLPDLDVLDIDGDLVPGQIALDNSSQHLMLPQVSLVYFPPASVFD